jgi:hypothetical protein
MSLGEGWVGLIIEDVPDTTDYFERAVHFEKYVLP